MLYIIQAGINGKRLKLALEPEVAALWYMTDDEDRNSKAISIGSKYMVIDLGGGTADISIQERFPNEQLRVIQKASGGPWGGTCIDQNFVAYLKSVFGKNEFDRFQQQESGDYFEILNSFETKKRSNLDGRINLRIPMSLYAGKESKKFFFKKSKQVPMERDKLPIDLSIVMSWFDEPTDQLINHIKDTLSKPELRDVRIMMLVGGLAESKYIQTKLINNLPEIQLIVPEDAGLAVLKGAVIFGHTPSLVASRIMAYTYGIGAVELFNRTKHFGREKFLKDGNWYAGHCFKIFVHVNEEILSRHRVSHIFVPLNATSRIPVYRTLSVEPKYTTDPGCELLGEINIQNRTDIPLDDQKHNVTFMFGETELLVSVMDPSTGKEEQLTLNCLK
ncbi:hypothetical protein DPMN_014277 [Dreissena polymorpha]|uniref:Uncharacterized protein n=1 Tax=Dreissena polymorpha TaxID=45954 RepID=A0A9D4S4E8_DREPO|nr:hypothetical protein DPMN_014277 [Dreissena polymorpha]